MIHVFDNKLLFLEGLVLPGIHGLLCDRVDLDILPGIILELIAILITFDKRLWLNILSIGCIASIKGIFILLKDFFLARLATKEFGGVSMI